jgi:3-mercaptopropionate dioxygenase
MTAFSANDKTGIVEPEGLLRQLVERAVCWGDTDAMVRNIQLELAEKIRRGQIRIGAQFTQIKPGSYARRLLIRDSMNGYTVVVMTWAPGQATPLHDHGGIWCVEGVIQGELNVTRYKVERKTGKRYFFSKQQPIRASVGSTGSLIPPDEYHVLMNTADATAVTLHIYGGEMDRCNVYEPRTDGWHERTEHALAYDA